MVTSCGVTDIDVIGMTGCMVLSPSERIQVGAFEKKTKKELLYHQYYDETTHYTWLALKTVCSM